MAAFPAPAPASAPGAPAPAAEAETGPWDLVHDLGLHDRRGPLAPHLQQGRQAAAARLRQPGRQPPFVREKITAGLILVRTPDQAAAARDASGGRREYQAVLVEGRLTYAFSEFVQGRYERKRLDTVRTLVDQMSLAERHVLASLDFDKIWDYARLRQYHRARGWKRGVSSFSQYRAVYRGWKPPRLSKNDALFVQRKTKFASSWLNSEESSRLLRRLLYEAQGVGQERWEFPKGKRHGREESDLSCALREFQEETRIPPSSVRLLPGFARVEMYVHLGVLYVNTYYLGVLARPIGDPSRRVALAHHDQVSEVTNVRWMGLEGMRLVQGAVGRDLTVLGRAAFDYVKRYYRGA